MMPLTLANAGEENTILKVGGSAEVKKHLEDLGFVAGGTVSIVSSGWMMGCAPRVRSPKT